MIEVRRLSQEELVSQEELQGRNWCQREELVSGIRIDLFFAPILIALTRRCGFKTFKALKKIRAFKPLWAVQKFNGSRFNGLSRSLLTRPSVVDRTKGS
jgi:hypothetical protein